MIPKSQWLLTDLTGQIVMFSPAAFLFIEDRTPAMFGYLSVGIWQFVSGIRYQNAYRDGGSTSRRLYGKALAWGFGIGVLTIPVGLFIFLVYVTPALAVWYLATTIHEHRVAIREERQNPYS